MMNISVAMTVCNGEKYLEQQIESIISQLRKDDELVISYDISEDNSYEILKEFQKKEEKIKLLKGPGKGVIANFENAINNCNKEYIFLCDQDDVWMKDKVDKVLEVFKIKNADLVMHDAYVTDKRLNVLYNSFFQKRDCKKGIIKNILKNSYIGCCMAFKKELKEVILPFPPNIPMHDQWIGILAEKVGKVVFINNRLIYYRRHKNNLSKDTCSNIFTMIKWRSILIKNLLERKYD